MATLSSPGIGTGGLDVKSIISQLVKLEQRPLESLKLQAATTTTKISAFGQVQSLVSSLRDAASALSSPSAWKAMSAVSSSSDFVTATAGGSLLETSFDVEVTKLAQTQRTAAGTAFSADEAVTGSAGRLKIQLGSWSGLPGNDPVTFTKNSEIAGIDIDVEANATLGEIASAINGSKAGVTATILTQNGQQSLLLRSNETGENFGFNVTAQTRTGPLDETAVFTEIEDNTGLGRLATANINTADGATQRAANAEAKVNGLLVSSPTNTFEGSTSGVSGVTFKAEKVSEAGKPTTISVTKDNTAIQANLEAFVKAYNEINQMLNEGTKYDAATKSAGLFQGDSTAVSLQNSLRAALQSVGEGTSVYKRLADVGVVQKTGADPAATAALGGELTLDVGKLNKALSTNSEDVKKLFIGNNKDGVAEKMKALTSNLLGSDGFFKSKDGVLKASLKRNEKDQIRVNNQVNSFEQRLTARYTALDVQMSSLNALNAYISQQVTSWNKSNG